MAVFLVLRAPPDAETSAAQIEALGHTAIIAPLRHAEPIFDAVPEIPDAIVVTSVNALRLGAALPADWHRLPFFCVGKRSADYAAGLGFSDVRMTGDIEGLVPVIRAAGAANRRLLYLAGAPRRPKLEAAFSAQLVVWLRYQMVDLAELPARAANALRVGDCDAVLHFSEKSALLWFRLAQEAGLSVAAFSPVQACISVSVARQVQRCADVIGQTCRIVVAKDVQGESVIRAAIEVIR